MTDLTQASHQLYSRPPDERFATLTDLHSHCQDVKTRSRRIKEPGTEFRPVLVDGHLMLKVDGHSPHRFNRWSFSQLCSVAGVAKDTVNRLCPETATNVLAETLRQRTFEDTDLQALVLDDTTVRAVNGERYKRLWSADLVSMLLEFATDFTPPQQGDTGGTGLYAGEQDMFCFLIDPTGWTEIGDETFAPGFFVWNSEVGRRTVGVSTFWFQAVCQNHIIWDVTDVNEYTRKHSGKVRDSLAHIRAMIESLVQNRDQRKDGFSRVIAKAMETTCGDDAEEVQELLTKVGSTQALAKQATEIAQTSGRFTIWSVVDALTQIARDAKFAGSRTEADQKASSLLALVSQ